MINENVFDEEYDTMNSLERAMIENDVTDFYGFTDMDNGKYLSIKDNSIRYGYYEGEN